MKKRITLITLLLAVCLAMTTVLSACGDSKMKEIEKRFQDNAYTIYISLKTTEGKWFEANKQHSAGSIRVLVNRYDTEEDAIAGVALYESWNTTNNDIIDYEVNRQGLYVCAAYVYGSYTRDDIDAAILIFRGCFPVIVK